MDRCPMCSGRSYFELKNGNKWCFYCGEEFGFNHTEQFIPEIVLKCPHCNGRIPFTELKETYECIRCQKSFKFPKLFHVLHSRDELKMFKKAWSLSYYHSETKDMVSEYIIKFKKRDGVAIYKWASLAARALEVIPIRPDYVVRILSSEETCASGSRPMDYVGQKVAKQLSARYIRNLLMKTRKNQNFAKNKLTKEQRRAEIEGIYRVNSSITLSSGSILVIDDVITSGVTAETVAKVLREAGFDQLYFFSLAETDDLSKDNSDIIKFFSQ